ncbi:MAG: peptidase M24 [Patescibacteria group bacterium]|nr:MAG: peptidase M24 [Patescibacteria group bacterium]
MTNRILKLQKQIDRLSYHLITNPVNISYLLDLKFNLKDKECLLILSKRQAVLITFPMLGSFYKNICQNLNLELKVIKQKQELIKFLKNQTKIKAEKLVLDSQDIKITEYFDLKKHLSKQITLGQDPTYKLRALKEEPELNKIIKAQKLTGQILKQTIEFLKQNLNKQITETDLACFIAESALKHKCLNLAFDPIVAFDKNSTNPHHRVSNKVIKSGVLLIDLGIVYKGYCSDLTRTFFIGYPTPEFKTIYDIVLKALNKSFLLANKTTGFHNLHTNAVNIFKKHSLDQYFIHSIGHGIGREIHEEPFTNPSVEGNLVKNTVFTLEPGLYLKNRFGIRIEDIVIKKSKVNEINVFDKTLENIIIKPA